MTTGQAHARVAVYLDFDNMVISRYDQLHGREAWRHDNARDHAAGQGDADPVAAKLAAARVDVGAIIDYASSFGTVALTRGYADWSVPANAAYKSQLVNRTVALTQHFPVSGTKNGADIELSIDAVDDLVRHGDLTHVVIVAGDSDFIPLARRCKQMGRYVVGIGVSGSTSRALVNACDEFRSYDDLPGVRPPAVSKSPKPAKAKTTAKKSAKAAAVVETEKAETEKAGPKKAASAAKASRKTGRQSAQAASLSPAEQEAVDLLRRAVSLAQDKSDEDWLHGGGLKSQMQRMDPGFKEKQLGYKSFTEFVQAHPEVVESKLDPAGHLLLKLATH